MSSNYETAVDGPKLQLSPTIRKKFPELKNIHNLSAVMMHEVQMLDSRMNLHALLTSSIDSYISGMKGVTLANYVEFKDFIKNKEGKIEGAVLFDKIQNK